MTAALEHPIGPTTVEDWLAQEHPTDGSRLELILGYLHVNPPPSWQHQYFGDELRAILKSAIRESGRTDLVPVTGVGIKISTSWRTALIPDLAVVNTRPVEISFEPSQVELVVEIWSPANTRTERETKMAAYAGAGVSYFWAVDQDGSVSTYWLKEGRYVGELVARPGSTVTSVAAPVPVTLDPAELRP